MSQDKNNIDTTPIVDTADDRQEIDEILKEIPNTFTSKEKLFMAFYIITLRGTQSARDAGYAESGVKSMAYKLLHYRDDIRKFIDSHLKRRVMSVENVKARLSRIAEGTIEDMVKVEGDKIKFDWKKADTNGALYLIKKLKIETSALGNDKVSIELHDVKEALVDLGKLVHGLKEKIEIDNSSDRSPLVQQYEEMLRQKLAELKKNKSSKTGKRKKK
jgi:phage terminase small subunit